MPGDLGFIDAFGGSEAAAARRLSRVFDELPAAVALLSGPDHVIEYANPAYRALVRDRVQLGLPVAASISETVQQGFVDLLDRVYRTGETHVGGNVPVVMGQAGAEFVVYVDFSYHAICDGDGNVEAVWVHAVDVSDRAEARAALEAALRREHANRFARAFDTMLDSIMIALPRRDEQGRVTDFVIDYFHESGSANVEARTSAELRHQTVSSAWPAMRSAGLIEMYANVVETGQPLVLDEFVFTESFAGVTLSVFIDVRATRLDDELLVVWRNVTERVERERALTRARQQLAEEHRAVELLQQAMLPRHLPQVPGVTAAARYVAATSLAGVGGDWFDIFLLADGRVGVVIGDVAGKGLTAAELMSQLRVGTRLAAIHTPDPARIAEALNALILTSGSGSFATAIIGLYDPASGDLRYVNAGHLPPLVVDRNGNHFLSAPPSIVLGAVEGPSYVTRDVTLVEGQRLVLYTDGLIERRREPLDISLARLRTLDFADRMPEDINQMLIETFEVGDRHSDDVCILTIRRDDIA